MDVREKLVELLKQMGKREREKGGVTWYDVADHLTAHGVTVQEWISVEDRLPDADGIYLTCNKKKEYEFHLFQTDKRMWQAIWEEDGVTHWMPLPQPPKGE